MFGILSPREEYIEKIANEAVGLSKKEVMSLTKAVEKKAESYGLNSHQIKNVCARVNHIMFREKFAEDKLATYDIAVYSDIIKKPAVDPVSSSNVIKARTETMDKVAEQEEDYTVDSLEGIIDREKREIIALYKMAMENADEIAAMHNERDIKQEDIYNTVKSLVLAGESLDDIAEVLVKTWGKDNIESIKAEMSSIAKRLRSEGLLEGDMNEIDFEDISERELGDSELQKQASEFSEIQEKILEMEFVHNKVIGMMKEAGEYSKSVDIESAVSCSIITPEFVKMAARVDPGLYYADQLSGLINPNLASQAVSSTYSLAPHQVAGVRAITRRILPFAAALGAFAAYERVTKDVKYKKVKERLEDLPDFKDVPKKDFERAFDTAVKANPKLLDLPYALEDIVKKHIEYGAFDAKSISEIQNIGTTKPTDIINTGINIAALSTKF